MDWNNSYQKEIEMVAIALSDESAQARTVLLDRSSLVQKSLQIDDDLDIGKGIEIHSLSISEDNVENHPSRAELVGWLFLLGRTSEAGEVIGAAQISLDKEGERLLFAGVMGKEFADAVVDGIQALERIKGQLEGPYALRLLRLPAAFGIMLWAQNREDHIFQPLPPASLGLELKPITNIEEFTTKLQELAKQSKVLTPM